jgi:hypothetical protein
MSWTFIPRLPSKEAWDRRLFRMASSINNIFTQVEDLLKEKPGYRFFLRGQVAYFDLAAEAAAAEAAKTNPPPPLEPGQLPPRRPVTYVEFSGLRELKDMLKDTVGEREKETVASIIFYEWGWFRHS